MPGCCAFLDQFGFDYDLQVLDRRLSRSGEFDGDPAQDAGFAATTRSCQIMLATLREERAGDLFSPFLPICTRRQGRVHAGADRRRATSRPAPSPGPIRTMTARRFTVAGHRRPLPSCNGRPDWAMRWVALGVDYEMAGKDLIRLGQGLLGQDLPRAIDGRRRPKASTTSCSWTSRARRSRSRSGNGLTIEEWLSLRPAGDSLWRCSCTTRRARGEEAATST